MASEAESVLHHYATEIEADLGLRGIDIGAWHRGEMTDRQLLTLLQGLGETSAFRTAARGGDWSFDRYVMVAILNEIRAFRADMRAMLRNEDMAYEPLLSPRQEDDAMDWLRCAKSIHEDIIARMRGEKAN